MSRARVADLVPEPFDITEEIICSIVDALDRAYILRPPDRQAITEGWQGKQRCQPFGDDAGCSWSLQIPIRLAPSVFIDDIGQRNTANRPEPSHGVADRQ
ncbi:MAG TPA: hypothetical protein VII14_02890 [Xanthobacteraceae bacterium]